MMIPHSDFEDWIWPIPMYLDNPPVISDGYGRTKRGGKGHFGIDVMHSRRFHKTLDIGAVGTKNFVTYPGEEGMAVAVGIVQEVGKTSTGHFVRIGHRVGVEGRSLLSVYRHLVNVRSEIVKDTLVMPGTPLGLIGDDPSNKGDPTHMHFELWDIGKTRHYPESTFDPTTVMRLWRVKRIPQGDIVAHPHPPKLPI